MSGESKIDIIANLHVNRYYGPKVIFAIIESLLHFQR